MPAVNPFGFQSHKYSFRDFAELISVDKKSKKFRRITDDINGLQKQYLDVLYCSKDQGPNLQLIEDELKRRHPLVFNGESGPKYLYYALHIAMNHHSVERHNIRHKQNTNAKNSSKPRRSVRIEGDRIAPTDNGHAVALTTVRCGKGPIKKVEIFDLTDDSTMGSITHNNQAGTPQPPNQKFVRVPPKHIIASRSDNAAPSSVAVAPRPPSREYKPLQHIGNDTPGAPSTQRTQLSVSSQHDRATEVPSKEGATATRDTEIYKFLSTCQPPMTHYLHRFVDFGCLTSAYLRSMSLGRAEPRCRLLKKILGSGPFEEASTPSELEMDMAILEFQFNTYFLED